MYCGTSHSSQTVDGLRGLMEYKTGDDTLFSVTFDGEPVSGSLDIDYRPTSPVNVYSGASDLSHDSTDGLGHTNYYHETIEYLDHAEHTDVNVVMWSWCSIEGHNAQIYLDNFEELIDMYIAGGSKGRTVDNEVRFVFMTGYARGANGDNPTAPNSPYVNHKAITDYCMENYHYCLDYWSQDVYDYGDDTYNPYESGNVNAMHTVYMNTHNEGEDWFSCRSYSSGSVKYPAHTTNHITGNRRAYGAWYIWARLAAAPGDVNGDNIVDLADAVLALQISAGINPAQNINIVADVNGDVKIGSQEVIFIVETLSGIR
jgi:hypothetical protein